MCLCTVFVLAPAFVLAPTQRWAAFAPIQRTAGDRLIERSAKLPRFRMGGDEDETDFYMNGSCCSWSPFDDPRASRGRSASEEWGNGNAMQCPDLRQPVLPLLHHPEDDVRYDFASLLTCVTTSWPPRIMLPDVCRMLPGTRVDKWMGVVRRNNILVNREVEEEFQIMFRAIIAQHPSITVESDILESPISREAI